MEMASKKHTLNIIKGGAQGIMAATTVAKCLEKKITTIKKRKLDIKGAPRLVCYFGLLYKAVWLFDLIGSITSHHTHTQFILFTLICTIHLIRAHKTIKF